MLELAAGELDHRQLVVGDPRMEQVDGRDLVARGDRFGLGPLELAHRPQHLGAMDAAVAGDAADPARLDGLDPLRGAGEVGDRQKRLRRPAEDLTGRDGAELAGRRRGERLVEHRLGLVDPPQPHERASVQGQPDVLDVGVPEPPADRLRLQGGVGRAGWVSLGHRDERSREGEHAMGGALRLVLEEASSLVEPTGGDGGAVADVVVPDDQQGGDRRTCRLAGRQPLGVSALTGGDRHVLFAGHEADVAQQLEVVGAERFDGVGVDQGVECRAPLAPVGRGARLVQPRLRGRRARRRCGERGRGQRRVVLQDRRLELGQRR